MHSQKVGNEWVFVRMVRHVLSNGSWFPRMVPEHLETIRGTGLVYITFFVISRIVHDVRSDGLRDPLVEKCLSVIVRVDWNGSALSNGPVVHAGWFARTSTELM